MHACTQRRPQARTHALGANRCTLAAPHGATPRPHPHAHPPTPPHPARPRPQEAHEQGLALVVACPQEDAERYCEGLRLNGLTSSIEPNSC